MDNKTEDTIKTGCLVLIWGALFAALVLLISFSFYFAL